MLTEQFFAYSSIAHEVILWFLILLSVLSIAVMMERFFFLKKALDESTLILSEMVAALESGRNAHMKLIYDKYALLPMGGVLRQAWDCVISKSVNGLEELLNAYILNQKIKLEGRLGFLATLGSNAPFLGLLGTIFGVMESFKALGSLEASVDVVMVGISKALVATAIGLIVAIPAITAYNYLQKKWRMIINNMESMKSSALCFAKNCKNHSKIQG